MKCMKQENTRTNMVPKWLRFISGIISVILSVKLEFYVLVHRYFSGSGLTTLCFIRSER